jgi:hypothetical protein
MVFEDLGKTPAPPGPRENPSSAAGRRSPFMSSLRPFNPPHVLCGFYPGFIAQTTIIPSE